MARSYLPHTENDIKAMLAEIGVQSIQDLFNDIPSDIKLKKPLDLPRALAESELVAHLRSLASSNANLQDYSCFLGAGAYDHYIPSVVDHIIGRSEFYTAYTQYQPEIAQGYLQALWEYQSMICSITGMEAANASLYDGSTAIAEAAMMACSTLKRKEIVVASSLNPNYRAVLKTYGKDLEFKINEVSFSNGIVDSESLDKFISKNTAAVIVQHPNFFGCVEDIESLSNHAHSVGAYLIVAANPISLGLLEAPGYLGADIVVGEGQALGLPTAFGGPYLGFFATTEKLIRKMPGRIVGQTSDFEGNRGFVLTLQAREQHIRREKANSNICSNEALCALGAAVYLSTLGRKGFREIAELCLQKAHYASRRLSELNGCELVFSAPFFNEFVIKLNKPVKQVNKSLLSERIIGGFDLSEHYPELSNSMLLCVTEKRSKSEIDKLANVLGAIL
ncbi:aminomethyl-transferring glycine dehydrogenase subunit GcvPA [Dendrosporobacter sp. 1207_IL3150]|uniref:aminomethyl-transferring glycine dehydrogenase subunit GcvPA n=1 Tax=Dendrosporobacter sp. 1207_IL3150 TaxID=3084054 RepID=UPI002FDB58B0